MAYRTTTNLDKFIKEYQNKVSIERNKPITIREVMEELGEYADISWQTVKQIKNKNMQPSLAGAMRIAEFFQTTIEEIWTVEEFENIEEVKHTEKTKKEKKEKPQCSHPNCYRDSIARGFCNKHYQNFRNHNPEEFNIEKQDTCSEEGCNNPFHAKGLCSIHYNKYYRESRIGE